MRSLEGAAAASAVILMDAEGGWAGSGVGEDGRLLDMHVGGG